MPKKGIVAEVGVAEGDFSAEILETCEPAVLHLIDYWGSSISTYSGSAHERVAKRFAQEVSQGRVRITRKLSWDGLSALPDGSIDWCYLDAAHDFDSVRRDLAAALLKIKPHGYIAGHDYIMWAGPTGRYGVVEAVNEFCIEQGWEMAFLSMQCHMHMSYAIRRISEHQRR